MARKSGTAGGLHPAEPAQNGGGAIAEAVLAANENTRTGTASNRAGLAGIARSVRKGWSSSSRGADDCLTYEQLKELRKRARSNDKTTDEVAEELSIALKKAEYIRAHNLYIPGAYDQLTFVFDCLLAAKPQLILARDARLNLQLEIYRRAGLLTRTLARLSSGSPVALVLLALFISFVVWSGFMVLIYYVSSETAPKIFFMDGRALAVITGAALIGGIVSIATRVHEFSRVRDLDPFAMFWTAMLKPLIGVTLAVFMLAALEGNIISFGFLKPDSFADLGKVALSETVVSPDSLKLLYILWVLGFLSGFSERFAWDFVDRVQGASAGGDRKTGAAH